MVSGIYGKTEEGSGYLQKSSATLWDPACRTSGTGPVGRCRGGGQPRGRSISGEVLRKESAGVRGAGSWAGRCSP